MQLVLSTFHQFFIFYLSNKLSSFQQLISFSTRNYPSNKKLSSQKENKFLYYPFQKRNHNSVSGFKGRWMEAREAQPTSPQPMFRRQLWRPTLFPTNQPTKPTAFPTSQPTKPTLFPTSQPTTKRQNYLMFRRPVCKFSTSIQLLLHLLTNHQETRLSMWIFKSSAFQHLNSSLLQYLKYKVS